MTKDELIAKPKKEKKECEHTYGVSSLDGMGILFLSYRSRNSRERLTFLFRNCPNCGKKIKRDGYGNA